MTTIQDTLRLFGITHCYKGYNHMVYAVQLVMEDESRLEAVTKELYMETAEHFGCKWYSVERNLHTVIDRAWKINSQLLCEIADLTTLELSADVDELGFNAAGVERAGALLKRGAGVAFGARTSAEQHDFHV